MPKTKPKGVKRKECMAEADTTNTSVENTADSTSEGQKEQTKTFSQDEVDNLIRKRVNEVKQKSEEKVKVAVSEAIKEYERQAKLSAEEKAAEETKKREAELENKEHDLLIRENRAEAREILQEKGISQDILNYVVDTDVETTKKNIAVFEKLWNKAVEEGVNKKLAGKQISDPSSQTGIKTEDMKTSTHDLLFGR